jgi:predicted metal-dependent peptidase
VFEYADGLGEVAALVYMTDGCGPAPDVAPEYPVIWALVSSYPAPVEYGEVVEIKGVV